MVSKSPFQSNTAKVFCFILIIFVLTFCDDDEYPEIISNVSFTFQSIDEGHTDWRLSRKSVPAYVILTIEDVSKKPVESNRKLAVHLSGGQFISDNLKLSAGDYRLTKFVVLDSAYSAIHAAPKEGVDFAQLVDDPLPLIFSIGENSDTHVAAPVLPISADDIPEHFGYESFDFNVKEIPPAPLVNLSVKLLPAPNNPANYDSVYIRFFNPDKVLVKQQRLILDSATHGATAIVEDLPSGDWIVSINYFRTLVFRKESELQTGSAAVKVAPSTVELLSDGYTMYVADSIDDYLSQKTINWDLYYSFYFFDNDLLNAIVTLPVDPLNPYFEISLINPLWDYFYADRTFYDARPNEPGSNYLQGAAAFEKYNDSGEPVDYLDTTSFKALTDAMRDKDWDLADCLVIFYIDAVEQPILYHQWHNKISGGGRRPSAYITKEQIEVRRRANLGYAPAQIFPRGNVLPAGN